MPIEQNEIEKKQEEKEAIEFYTPKEFENFLEKLDMEKFTRDTEKLKNIILWFFKHKDPEKSFYFKRNDLEETYNWREKLLSTIYDYESVEIIHTKKLDPLEEPGVKEKLAKREFRQARKMISDKTEAMKKVWEAKYGKNLRLP